MAEEVVSKSIIKQNDWTTLYIVVVAMGLTMLGLVMLFSAGVAKDAHSLLTKQIVWVGLSVCIAIYFSLLNLDWIKDKTWIIFGLCLFGLILTLLPGVGIKVNGAQRWIGIGALRVQPSEFAKIGLVLVIAGYCSSCLLYTSPSPRDRG